MTFSKWENCPNAISCEYDFVVPHFVMIELFKYKEKIISLTKKNEIEVLEIIYHLLLQVSFYNEKDLSLTSRQAAYDLCKDIDLKDAVFVALSIELNAPIWTGDQKLKKGLITKGFTNFFED
ncbi:MAG: PIN domain-containing protein [Spirosomataceae bacterium]